MISGIAGIIFIRWRTPYKKINHLMKKHVSFILIPAALSFCSCSSTSNSTKNNATSETDSTKQVAEKDSTEKIVRQEIKLPAPYDTKSAIHFSKAVGWPEGLTPKAPEGFKVTEFAGDLQNPRWIYVLPNRDVLVAATKKEEKGIRKVVAKITGISKTHNDETVNL